MGNNGLKTFNAPAERLEGESIKNQIQLVNLTEFYIKALDSMNVFVFILNSYRQIVYANKAYLKLIGVHNSTDILGKRLGETLNCINAFKNDGGCGTSKECKNCSVGNIVLKSINIKQESEGESSIVRKVEGFDSALNLFEKVAPIEIKNETFYLGSFIDATDSIKRRSMEKIFFHDVINTAGALKGILSLLKTEVPKMYKDEIEQVEGLFGGLIDEIQSQKQILLAENNELFTEFDDFNSKEVLRSLRELYKESGNSLSKTIKIDGESVSVEIKSDITLVKRIVGYMIKNALEVNNDKEIITIGCRKLKDSNIEYWVKNNAYICEDIQDSIFKRAFSTKGNERGLGTYSMKLLGEKYLNGSVGFTSNEKQGTCFYIRIPQGGGILNENINSR